MFGMLGLQNKCFETTRIQGATNRIQGTEHGVTSPPPSSVKTRPSVVGLPFRIQWTSTRSVRLHLEDGSHVQVTMKKRP